MASLWWKAKEIVHNHWILVDRAVSHGSMGKEFRHCDIQTHSTLYAGTEQLGEWMVDGGSQVSHCWSGSSEMSMGGS